MELLITFVGQQFKVRPRTALIVKQILEQTADIEAIPFGSLTFHLAGRKIQPELTRSYRALAVDPDQKDEAQRK